MGLALFWNKNPKGLRVMGLGFFLRVLLGKMENKEKEDNEAASIFEGAVGLGIGNPFLIMLIMLCHHFLAIPFHPSVTCLVGCSWSEKIQDFGPRLYRNWPGRSLRLCTAHCFFQACVIIPISYKNTFTKLLWMQPRLIGLSNEKHIGVYF